MILVTAQTKPERDNIYANLNDHYRLINVASGYGADLILFPEMSITGYERQKAKESAFSENDTRLNELRRLSVKNQIMVIAGAPVLIKNDTYIGAFIIRPDDSVSIYTKQYLHTGEDIYFKSSFNYNPVIEIEKERISLAVCADINDQKHPENAKMTDTTIYLASIFWEPEDMVRAHKTLSGYAEKYSMNVLMSNFTGQSWELNGGGQSGFWNSNGDLVGCLNSTRPGLLFVEKVNNLWKDKRIIYE